MGLCSGKPAPPEEAREYEEAMAAADAAIQAQRLAAWREDTFVQQETDIHHHGHRLDDAMAWLRSDAGVEGAATEKQLRRLERAEEEADRERRRTAAERVAAEQELQRLNREE